MQAGRATEMDAPSARKTGVCLREIADGAAAAVGLEVVHVQYRKEGHRWVVRLFVERPGGAVTLDDCARASEQFGAALEVADVIPQKYTLEVSSPGLDRPLFSEADYRRFAGRAARLTTTQPLNGRRHFHGIILGCDAGQARLHLDDGREVAVPVGAIASARLDVVLDQEL
jgi:ribosome maturation factor RimP